jgi:hypothetical protein
MGILPRSDESVCSGTRLPAVQVSPSWPRIVRPDGSQRDSQRVHVEPLLAKVVAATGGPAAAQLKSTAACSVNDRESP